MLKILLIDDDESVRLMLTKVLKKKFLCEILEAENGLEALEILAHDAPDVAFLDVAMPLMDGIETLEAIRTDRTFFALPVIMLTAQGDKSTVGKLIQKGISDFLLKPIDLNIAYDRIYKVISRVQRRKPDDLYSGSKKDQKDGKPRLLLIEKDLNFRSFVSSLLEQKFDVILAGSGMEGLQLFLKQVPDYVLIGEKLPLLNEKLLAQKIHAAGEDSNARIFFVAENPTRDIDSTIFNGVLKKSFIPDQFMKDFNHVVIGKEDVFEIIKDLLHEELQEQIVSAIRQTFGVMTYQDVEILEESGDAPAEKHIEASIDSADSEQKAAIRFVMTASEQDVLKTAEKILGMPVSLEEGAKDALGELINTIAGRLRSAFEEKGIKLENTSDVNIGYAEGSAERFEVCVPFICGGKEKFLFGIVMKKTAS